MKFKSLIVLYCLFSLSFAFVHAQDSTKRQVRVGWLEVTGTITKENYENIDGYARQYLDKIVQYTNWELVFVKGTFADLYPKLLSGEIELLPSFGYSEERTKLVNYPNLEMAYAYTSLYVRQDSVLSDNNISALDGILVAALSPDELNKQNLDAFAKENGLHFNYIYFNSYEEMEKAVVEGRVAAGIEPNHIDDDVTKTVLQFGARSGYLACTPVDPTIVEGVNFAQEKLLEVNPNFLKDLLKRYHPRAVPIEFVLTREEQDLIHNSPALKVLVGNRWQPYEFYNWRTKVFSGYIVDLYNKVSELTGLKFEFVYEDNEFDFDIIGVSENNITFAEKKGYKITEPFLSLPFTLIYKNIPKLHGGTIALVEGAKLDYTKFKSFSNMTAVYFKDANACLEAVRQGKVNQTLLDSFTANYEIERKRKFSKLSVFVMDETFDLCSLVDENVDPIIFHILNRGLSFTSTRSSNFFLLQNAYKSNEIGLLSIINKMPLDIILIFVTLFFITIIIFLLYRTKNAKEKFEKKRNAQLQDALISAEKANEAKTSFTSRISHEIRSPLNAIIGYMSLVKVDEKNTLALNYLSKAEAAAQQLLSLLNDVLDMSRIESGKIQISKREFVMEDIIETLSTLFTNEAKVAGLSFSVERYNLKNEILFGDQLRLLQILTNLLSNAVKFTHEGGQVRFVIKEEQRREGKVYILFSVEDTGIGIEPEFLEKIFTPYERQSLQNDSKIAGTGLGLAITKNLVNLMEGTICVESKVGQGSNFTVMLPFEIKENAKEVQTKNERAFLEKEILSDFYGKQILVVEDNEMNIEIISAYLDKYRISTDIAHNGKEAVDMFLDKPENYYNLILMDIQMPVLNGYEATIQIRSSSHPRAKTIPIVAMTANAFVEDISKSLASGMNKHLTKPIDITELYKILKEFLGK